MHWSFILCILVAVASTAAGAAAGRNQGYQYCGENQEFQSWGGGFGVCICVEGFHEADILSLDITCEANEQPEPPKPTKPTKPPPKPTTPPTKPTESPVLWMPLPDYNYKCGENGHMWTVAGFMICRCNEGFGGFYCDQNLQEVREKRRMQLGKRWIQLPENDECGENGQMWTIGGFLICRCNEGYTGFACEKRIEEPATKRQMLPSPQMQQMLMHHMQNWSPRT